MSKNITETTRVTTYYYNDLTREQVNAVVRDWIQDTNLRELNVTACSAKSELFNVNLRSSRKVNYYFLEENQNHQSME